MIEMKPEVKTNADCARYCVRERGGRFVLQTLDKVYKLDKQVLAEQWAGLKVKIVGTLDPKTGVIAVRTIEPAPRERARHLLQVKGKDGKIPAKRAKTPPPRIVVGGHRNHNQSRHKSLSYFSPYLHNYF
jgi:hypothetical protein